MSIPTTLPHPSTPPVRRRPCYQPMQAVQAGIAARQRRKAPPPPVRYCLDEAEWNIPALRQIDRDIIIMP